MKKTVISSLVLFAAMAIAGTRAHNVTLFQDSVIEGQTIKAGDYKISVVNGNAILTRGKQTFEVPAREESAANKVPSTELLYKDKSNLEAIQIGGSQTKIVFEGSPATQPGM